MEFNAFLGIRPAFRYTYTMEPFGPCPMADLQTTFGVPVRTEFKLMAEMRVREPNIPLSDIAKRLGFSYQTILMWSKKPLYQAYETWLVRNEYAALPPEVRRAKEEVQDGFAEFAGEMQDRLLAILETTPDQRLAATIAQDWLDRAGHTPIHKQELRGVSFTITAELHAILERRAREADGTALGLVPFPDQT